MRIKWSRLALVQLDAALEFISGQGFVTYAAEPEDKIIKRIENLTEHHAIDPIDNTKKITTARTGHLKLTSIGYLIE